MTPPPLSNYPREAPPIEPRIWIGDAIVGGAGLLDLIPSTHQNAPEMLARTEQEPLVRAILIAALAALLLFAAALQVLLIFRKRWAMWLLLALTLLSLVLVMQGGFRDEQKDPFALLSTLIEIVTFGYLPLRLFGKLGPAPR